MTIKLSTLGGGGGDFVTRFKSDYLQLGTGGTGVILTLTPPAGQRVMLEALHGRGSGATESDISVSVGGSKVIDTKLLDDNNAAATIDAFCIGVRGGAAGDMGSLLGGVDEVIEVIKETGSVLSNIGYAYRFGE